MAHFLPPGITAKKGNRGLRRAQAHDRLKRILAETLVDVTIDSGGLRR